MYRQKVYDHVKQRLLAQGRRSGYSVTVSVGDDEFTCKYYGPGTDRCAIGHLLTPERHEDIVEGMAVADIPLDAFLPEFCPTGRSTLFLEDLQKAHDETEDGENFNLRLTARLGFVAEAWLLKP